MTSRGGYSVVHGFAVSREAGEMKYLSRRWLPVVDNLRVRSIISNQDAFLNCG